MLRATLCHPFGSLLMTIISLILSTSGYAIDNTSARYKNSTATDHTSNALPIKKENPFYTHRAASVRVGFRLAHFVGGPNFSERTIIERTLRARIDKPNHFLLDSYHIETIPLRWIRKTQAYSMRISLSQRFGESNDMQKYIGFVDIHGVLKKQHQPKLYLLMGAAAKTFHNKHRIPILKVVAGYGRTRPSTNYQPHPKNTPLAYNNPSSKSSANSISNKTTFQPRHSLSKSFNNTYNHSTPYQTHQNANRAKPQNLSQSLSRSLPKPNRRMPIQKQLRRPKPQEARNPQRSPSNAAYHNSINWEDGNHQNTNQAPMNIPHAFLVQKPAQGEHSSATLPSSRPQNHRSYDHNENTER